MTSRHMMQRAVSPVTDGRRMSAVTRIVLCAQNVPKAHGTWFLMRTKPTVGGVSYTVPWKENVTCRIIISIRQAVR